jgi:hypothetical protein
MTVSLDQPARVVQLPPLLQRGAQRLDVAEPLHRNRSFRTVLPRRLSAT